MKPASVSEIRNGLKKADKTELEEVCLRLARFKQENKELITYLLFEADDESSYVKHVKEHFDEMFLQVNRSNLYYAKKNIRKIVRTANKFIRYSGIDVSAVEISLHLCAGIRKLDLDMDKSQVLQNIYSGLLKKIEKLIDSLHEDLQFEYRREWQKLMKSP